MQILLLPTNINPFRKHTYIDIKELENIFWYFIRLAVFDSLESPTIAVFGFHRDFETIVFFFSCFDVIHDFTDHVSDKKIRQYQNVPFLTETRGLSGT